MATIPMTSITIYIVNIKGNLRKYAISAALTYEGENHLKPNTKLGSYLTSERKIFAPSKSSSQISEKAIMGVIMKRNNLRKR